MKKKIAKKPPVKARPNVADSIDGAARRIAASLSKTQTTDEWDQEQVHRLFNYNGRVGEIPVSMIRTNQNIRRRIDEEAPDFRALVESIKTHGVLQPPIVTVITSETGVSSILLVGGERRLRAAIQSGYKSIHCMVRIFDNPSTRLTASVAENMNRRDLECLDIGQCFFSLTEQGYKYSDIEKLFNRDEKTIGRYIKMAKWPESVQTMIRENEDKFSARFLLSVASRKLTDTQVEKEITAKIAVKAPAKGTPKPQRQPLSRRLSDYVQSHGLSQKDHDLVYKILVDLGVMPPVSSKGKKLRSIHGATASTEAGLN